MLTNFEKLDLHFPKYFVKRIKDVRTASGSDRVPIPRFDHRIRSPVAIAPGSDQKSPNFPSADFVTTIHEHVSSEIAFGRGQRQKATAQKERKAMSEFESEVKKAEKELEQGLVPVGGDPFANQDEFLGDIKMQAQEYGQKFQDAASKAKDFASEKFAYAEEKFKELKTKDPKELVEDAKEFARQKPGQTILISAAIGLVIGFLLKGRK